tara:strand:- start:1260 stop:2135 length:876 start_codon:yes stop_codon:yes gene_type:complete
MSSYGEFYPPSNNDNCILDTTFAGSGALSGWTTNVINDMWRGTKFARTASGYTNSVRAGGDSGVLNVGYASNVVVSTFPPSDPITAVGTEMNQTYLRFDTSSLDDDLEITGVKLGLYVTGVNNGYSFSSPALRIFAGITGESDRPTFSSPINISNDNAWFCESAYGCGSGSCSKNEGATDVATFAHSSISTGARNEITLTDGTNLDDGSSTVYEDWVNRTGYTYILVTHNMIADTSSSTICNNYVGAGGDTIPVTLGTGAKLTNVSFSGGTSGNAPYLAINQGKSQFQMII